MVVGFLVRTNLNLAAQSVEEWTVGEETILILGIVRQGLSWCVPKTQQP
jgi:hypothetical protein